MAPEFDLKPLSDEQLMKISEKGQEGAGYR